MHRLQDPQVPSRLDPSPLIAVCAEIRHADPKWRVDVGVPGDQDGWIRGVDFTRAGSGPFHDLLQRTGARLKTADRKTIAALFALRFGWAGGVALAPYLTHGCVLDVSLENVSFRFREDTLFDRASLHQPRGLAVLTDVTPVHPSLRLLADTSALTAALREMLRAQAAPVVAALHAWSGFSVKATWGMLTSSWASQIVGACDRLGGQAAAAPVLDALCAGTDDMAAMRPRLHPVTCDQVTHLFQRRASCCRWYLLPQGSLCASCPLVSQEDRVARNLAFMQKQLAAAR